jgi:parallel beta-helix repeat protein
MSGNAKALLAFTTILLLITFLSSNINAGSAQTSGSVVQVPNQYATIQSAINAANNGDTIQIAPGRYYETVNVNKSVSIIGQSAASTTVYGLVEGYDQSSNGSPFYVSASNVVIANLTIKQGQEYRGAIGVSGAHDIIITGNIITQGYGYSGTAIGISDCNNFAITNNTISEDGGLINIQNSQNGEISANTITNSGYTILLRDSANIKFKDNIIAQCDDGILITNTPNCVLEQNHVSAVGNGLSLTRCPQSTLSNNVVADCWEGITINECPGTQLRGNLVTNSTQNFDVFGYTLDDFNLDIDTSNKIDSKPIYYIKNQNNLDINPTTYPSVGYLALINCNNATVQQMTLTNNAEGILLAHTTNSLITHNTFVDNTDSIYLLNQSDHNTISFNQISWYGTGVRVYESESETIIGNSINMGTNAIWIEQTSGNTIVGNTLSNNYEALHSVDTSDNAIYHNNFVSNTLSGAWDNQDNWNNSYPAGGNYWGTTGTDLYSGISQGELGSDGILDEGRYYPLTAPVQMFEAGKVNGAPVYIELESNSTIQDVYIDMQAHSFSFKATGASGDVGFCRITIPNSILQTAWQGNFTILLNGEAQSLRNWTDTQNTYFYVSYPQPSSIVSVVPEFSAVGVLVLLLVSSLVIGIATRSRNNKKQY